MADLPNHQSVQLNYFKWDDKFQTTKPYELLVDVPDDFPSQNFTVAAGPLETIHDIRGEESDFSLDQNGFIIRKDALPLRNWTRETIERDYFPVVDALIRREVDDVDEVCLFDWRVVILPLLLVALSLTL